MRKSICTVFLASICYCISSAQQVNKTKLDSFFNAIEVADKFLGKIAVSSNGENIYTRSIGLADCENNIETTETTKYRIGSISKTFTAALVLKAVEEKKIKLHQTLESYFPTIKNAKNITIADLLNHRSGIHNFTDEDDYYTWNTKPIKEKDMIEKISEMGSDFEPDSTAEYSNSNYLLLTYILEKEYSKPYAELLSHYITKPFGLSDTYLGGKISIGNNEAKSYRHLDRWYIEPETDLSISLGAGGIVSTPKDIIAFGEALFAGRIISQENVNLMKSFRDGYGMGLLRFPFYERKLYGHTGAIDGFSSMWGHLLEDNFSFAITSNGANMDTNDIAIAILSAFYGKRFDVPEFSTYELSEDDLKKYPGKYSSLEKPLKVTISIKNKTLIAQETGQPAFPLEASAKNKFKFKQADVIIEFDPATNSMLLKQYGEEHTYSREPEDIKNE